MDKTTIMTAIAMLAVLTAWYALLEYEERRRKDVERPKHLPETGGREASRERKPGAGDYMTQQRWRSNGRPLPGARPPRAPGGRSLVFRGRASRYGFAVASVFLAGVFVAVGNLLFSFPPLIFFAAAVAATLTLAGAAPGLSALVLATLLSDFFFVRPRFVFSLDWQVFRLSLGYLLAGLLSALISKLLSSRAAVS